jgi:hypothetical protein
MALSNVRRSSLLNLSQSCRVGGPFGCDRTFFRQSELFAQKEIFRSKNRIGAQAETKETHAIKQECQQRVRGLEKVTK